MLDREPRQKMPNVRRAELCWMPTAVMGDETARPRDVRFFGAATVVQKPELGLHLLDEEARSERSVIIGRSSGRSGDTIGIR